MDKGLNKVILELHEGMIDIPFNRFQEWALHIVQKLIPFDSAMWGSGTYLPEDIHSMYLFNQPQEMLDVYVEKYQRDDFLRKAAILNAGTTINIRDLVTREEFEATEVYKDHAKRWRMEGLLCTVLTDQASGLLDFISFWRADPDNQFSDRDRQRKELLMPHLVAAWRNRKFLQVRLQLAGRSEDQGGALADKMGYLQSVEPGFIRALRRIWPHWAGSLLPQDIINLIKKAPGQIQIGSFEWDVVAAGDLYFVRARATALPTNLTKREIQLIELAISGASYAMIADKLTLSSNTVRNHLQNIYRKLNVTNRVELMRRMNGRGLNF